VLGLAYKKNVDDVRESPSLVLLEKLRDRGAEVAYSDPHVPVCPPVRRRHLDLKSVSLDAKIVAGFDCVLVATPHDRFDWALIERHAPIIVDTRGVFAPRANHIYRA